MSNPLRLDGPLFCCTTKLLSNGLLDPEPNGIFGAAVIILLPFGMLPKASSIITSCLRLGGTGGGGGRPGEMTGMTGFTGFGFAVVDGLEPPYKALRKLGNWPQIGVTKRATNINSRHFMVLLFSYHLDH